MNRVFSRLGLTAVAIVAGSALYAQSTTTGAINGVATDANGAALSGVTITLNSGQITRTIVTGADGSFRMGLLNPGNWAMKAAKDGFQNQSYTVSVAPNDTRSVNFKLAPVSQTTVEVTAVASVIDPTSTVVGQNISMDQVASVPKGRDFSSVAYFTPGVADGGFAGNSPSMSGASAAENTYYVDGLDTTDYRYGFQGAQLKTDFIDQVSVQTAGFAPEFSALGGVINAITKSGSNDFKGSAWLTWDAVGIHATQKQNQFVQEAAPNTRYDLGAEVSGPILKDKLFYFAGVDAEVSQGQASVNNTGLVSDKSKVNNLQSVFKINWFITPDMQLTWFGNYNNIKTTDGHQYYLNGDGDAGVTDKYTIISTNLAYDWSITPSLALSLKGGFFQLDEKQNPTTDVTYYGDSLWFRSGPGSQPGGNPMGLPITTRYNHGGAGLYLADEKNKTTQFDASLAWYVGTHSMKFGASYLESEYHLGQQMSGGAYSFITSYSGSLGGAYLNRYQEYTNATVKADFSSLYAQDNWEVVSGFRLLFGFRYETQEQKDYRGETFLKFNKVGDVTQPRLGFTWDVNNDGKTKVSGSWARYYEKIPQRMAIRVFANEVYLRNIYLAASGHFTYNANGTFTYAAATPDIVIDYSTPFSYDPIADGTKIPQRDEVALGVDHTFDNGWTAGLHATYRKLKNPIEDSVITNAAGSYYSADGHAILWNPHPGTVTWTQASVSPDAGARITGQSLYPYAVNTYQSATFSLDKRTDRDFISFSYTYSKLFGNYEGVVSSSNGQADGNITASFDYYPYVGYGPLPLDRTNVAKLQYSHRFTVAGGDLNFGANWSYQSGTPLSEFDNGSNSTPTLPDIGGYGNATPLNGLYGQLGRTPATQTTDIHVDYTIKAGAKFRVAPSIDIFNLFNSREETGQVQQATTAQGSVNPSYGFANGWLEGRHFRFGVKVQF